MATDKIVYQVSELSLNIKTQLEQNFSTIWVSGELSNCKQYASGHFYFSLSDKKASVRAVMFHHQNRLLCFEPRDGLHVLIQATASVYQPRGDLQLIVAYMEEAGEGRLKQAFEQLKQKLYTEGLFAASHKRTLPKHPQTIGVITSANGAALHDILTTIKRRSPMLSIIIYPVQVQGKAATSEIIDAITLANQRQECAVLILARGGGSLEDLQAFNAEGVAYAIFNSSIPIVSAIGHEVDISIADLVADIRAATPTAAAELVSQDQQQLIIILQALARRMHNAIIGSLSQKMQTIDYLSKSLKHPGKQLLEKQLALKQYDFSMKQRIQIQLSQLAQKLNYKKQQLMTYNPLFKIEKKQYNLKQIRSQLYYLMEKCWEQKHQDLTQLHNRLKNSSVIDTLKRGYSIILDENERAIISVANAAINDNINIRLQDGYLTCQVVAIKKIDNP